MSTPAEIMSPAPVAATAKSWLRPLYFALGCLSLGVAFAGIFLPLIPTTGPVLLAAFFFARSSERAHRWLLEHPRFGQFIRDFQEGRGIPRRAKVLAVTMMLAAFAFSIWRVDITWVRVAIAVVGAYAIWFVLSQPTADAAK